MNIAARCAAATRAVRKLIDQRAAEALATITRDFARTRQLHHLPPYAIGPSRLLRLPKRFECPECGGALIVEIDEWSIADGIPTQGGYRVMCEPDTDAELAAWRRDEDYRGHRMWQSDWHGVDDRVGRWMIRNVRVIE